MTAIDIKQIKSVGVLAFSSEGVLFIGDNESGSILAVDLTSVPKITDTFEINV